LKTIKPLHIALPLILGLLAACDMNVTGEQSASNTPACSLSVAGSIDSGNPVLVGLELHNTTGQAIEVLQYFTPFEGIMGPIFQLSYQGENLDYLGPMVKRMPPGDQDWLMLPSGESLKAEVDITLSWDLSRAGEYRVVLSNDISYRTPAQSEPVLLPAGSCGSAQFQVASQGH
jgi:hypothetical protein